MSSSSNFACGVCCLLSTIAIIVVLSISFHQLDQLDYGLDYDMVSASVSSEVFLEPGLHTLGPGHRFITYPRTIQTMSIVCSASTCNEPYDRLQTRTADGLGVSVSVSFQYRYDPSRLVDMYMRFKEGERQVFENTATAILSQVATNYTAYTFFNDLTGIATAMQLTLTEVFDQQLFTFVDSLQITGVDLPDQFESAIFDSIAAQQNITTMRRYRDNMLVTFDQQILVANQTRFQTIALAEGTARQRSEQADAAVTITTQTTTAEMYSYGNISETVGLDADGGLRYIWWDTQTEQGNQGKEYLVGLSPDTYIRQS